MEEEGRNIVYSYDELDGAHATVKHPTMSPDEVEERFRWLYREIYSWENMLARFDHTLGQGTWTQNGITLTKKEQGLVLVRLFQEYVIKGTGAQRKFFFKVLGQLGRRVNKESVVTVLLQALNWNEFANDLKPYRRPTDQAPIVFRTEYLVPVEKQTLGRTQEPSGVIRIGGRRAGPTPVELHA